MGLDPELQTSKRSTTVNRLLIWLPKEIKGSRSGSLDVDATAKSRKQGSHATSGSVVHQYCVVVVR